MQEILIGFIKMLGNFVMLLIPSINIESNIVSSVTNSITYMISIFKNISFIVPVADIFLMIGAIVVYRLGMFSIFVVNWVIKRVRGG